METTTIAISKDIHKKLAIFKIKTNAPNINEVLRQAIEKLGDELNELDQIYYSTSRRHEVKNQLYRRQKGICKCKKSFKSDELNIDHIKPRALGGSDDGKNLQLLCYRCHYDKTKNDLNEIWKVRKHGKI